MVGRQLYAPFEKFEFRLETVMDLATFLLEKNITEKCITPVFRVENDGDVYFKSRTTRNRF